MRHYIITRTIRPCAKRAFFKRRTMHDARRWLWVLLDEEGEPGNVAYIHPNSFHWELTLSWTEGDYDIAEIRLK